MKTKKHDNFNESKDSFLQGFYAGFTIILISGFGDKLFFLNMLYASINNFCYAFSVALAISEIMNLINISFGELLKKYVSIQILEYIAIGIFVLFGLWLIIKGLKMPEKRLIQNYDEERRLLLNNNKNNRNYEIQNEENNNGNNYKQINVAENESQRETEVGVFDSWWKYFITYFFASAGDKSQIASILITSKYSFISIFNGTVVGILILVFIAIVFGKSISRQLTNKQISIVCGIFFLLYALIFFMDKKIRNKIKVS